MEPVERLWVTPRYRKLYAWYLAPEIQPKAIILMVHGHGEHSKRYLNWAERFTANGYAFLAWDHFGHGLSDGKRGHINHYEQFMLEIDLAITKASEYFPTVPIILYGHSMGGNIVLNHAIRRCCRANGIIVTSPWLRLSIPISPFVDFFVSVLGFITPFITIRSKVLPSEISHIDEEVEKYKYDPLIHNKISPRLYLAIRNAGLYAVKYAKRIKTPVLIMHGEEDEITDFNTSKEIAEKIEGCAFVPWPNMYHELHNETVRGLVFETILKWLELWIVKSK